ncbi:MAG TPA: hypothetical protein VGN57_10170 [Pirellulaceae bacterium]|jgi:hypothetical protein|nr:hypothetical protein [Pirellulaceae bacterium]
MSKTEAGGIQDPEIAAISAVVAAMRDLDASTQQNVVDYIVRRFKLSGCSVESAPSPSTSPFVPRERPEPEPEPAGSPESDEDFDGISPIARKWISRSGLTMGALSKLYSLGIEEIDFVAEDVPGKGKKERMRSVIFLKSIAAYLGSGAARVTHEQIKETCLHYDAYDGAHFAEYLKHMSSEIGGSKEAGYTLTPRGLTAATALVKELSS